MDIDMFSQTTMGNLHIGDRVKTEFGMGIIILCNDAFTTVLHDHWIGGHNMPIATLDKHGEYKVKQWEGNSCYMWDTMEANNGKVRRMES